MIIKMSWNHLLWSSLRLPAAIYPFTLCMILSCSDWRKTTHKSICDFQCCAKVLPTAPLASGELLTCLCLSPCFMKMSQWSTYLGPLKRICSCLENCELRHQSGDLATQLAVSKRKRVRRGGSVHTCIRLLSTLPLIWLPCCTCSIWKYVWMNMLHDLWAPGF